MIAALRLVPTPVWWALVALLSAINVTQWATNAQLRAQVADQKVLIAQELQKATEFGSEVNRRNAEVARLTAELSEINRAAEALASARAKEIADVVIAEKKRTERAVAAAVADADRRLRDELAAFAAAAPGPSDSAAAAAAGAGLSAEDRAAALGSLLAACRREAVGDAGELEDLATQVRGLLKFVAALDNQ